MPLSRARVRPRAGGQLHILLPIFLLVIRPSTAGISVCNKSPKDQSADRTEGANGFSVSLNGSPRLYRPHQTYTISLKGWRNEQIVKFQDFLLVAEPAKGHEMLDANSLGTFQLMPGDAMTKFSHLCSHAIGATSSISKKAVEVYWIAPGRNSGCISFKAMVIERPGIWYMDDEELTYDVCEDYSTLAEPQDVDPCCACDEAKYEIVFEGIWSRHTHPKMFPEDEWRTQFSTLIGASHSSNYSIWDYGEIASSALQVLGEKGITRPLEAQMKRHSYSIRSVIKAHGLQQRSNVEGQTFAVFRVDAIHHLLSVVSKMIPSPDFIVGLSKENLCLPNCSWVPYRVLDLYPWDIGTDAGIAYNDPPTPLRPKEVIKRITSNYPNDPKSPFYDDSGAPIKPAARLHIVRQRTYKRSNCPHAGGGQSPLGMNPLAPSWIPNGGRHQDAGQDGGGRYYQEDDSGYPGPEEDENSLLLRHGGTHMDLREHEDTPISSYEMPGMRSHENSLVLGYNGYGQDIGGHDREDDHHDRDDSDRNHGIDDPFSSSFFNEGILEDNPCETTEWEPWSDCSSCDVGSRIRRRKFRDRSAAGMNNCMEDTFEKEICPTLPECSENEEEEESEDDRMYGGNFDLFESRNQRRRQWRNEEGSNDDALDVPEMYSSFDSASSDGVWNPFGGNTGQRSYEYPNSEFSNSMDCRVTEYGPWSDCSVSCGIGTMTRSRRYFDPEHSSGCSEDLTEVTRCTSPTCYDRPLPSRRVDNRQLTTQACSLSEWSQWSPCSRPCGLGYRLRTRLYLIPFVPNRSCDVRLMEKANCHGSNCNGDVDNSRGQNDLELMDLGEENPDLDDYYRPRGSDGGLNICRLPAEPGPCRGHYTRWYYNSLNNKCQKFVFFGCEGNKNNFASEESCLLTCHTRSNKDWDAGSSLLMPMDQPANPPRELYLEKQVDCESVREWSHWSPCSSTSCKENMGWKTRSRLPPPGISSESFSRSCPETHLSQKRRCRNRYSMGCLSTDHRSWYMGSWRDA